MEEESPLVLSTKQDPPLPHPMDQRPEYSDRTWPKEQADIMFTETFRQGERTYWDEGLREKLVAEGKKGRWIATDGTETKEAESLEGLIPFLLENQPKRFYVTRVGFESAPGPAVGIAHTPFGQDNRPVQNVTLQNPSNNNKRHGPFGYIDDSGKS
jgi:hypothetical protein